MAVGPHGNGAINLAFVPETEYRARQAATRAILRNRGYDALLAWSRGASTHDHAADVLYLTGHYTPQGFVPDTPAPASADAWLGRATGHAAVVLPREGPVTLITDSPPRADSPAVSDRVVLTADLIASTAGVLIESMRAFPESEQPNRAFRVALVGAEAFSSRWERALLARLAVEGKVELLDDDSLAWEQRVLKSRAEQALLRQAGALGARAMTAAMRCAVRGATEADVVAACMAEVMRGGGAWYGGGLSSAASADSFAPTGGVYGAAPSTLRTLELGDLVRFDAYGSVAGYVFDFARSFVVGRAPLPEQQLLLDAVRDSVQAGIDALRPGVTLGSVAQHCEEALASSEYARRHGVPPSVMGGAWGHGLGLGFEPPWITADSSVIVQAGMCFAVERRIEAPNGPASARGAQYEDNVLITETGAELLTPAPPQ